jgi:4-hydroxybenzoate polyprenyltransferase
MMRTNNLGLDTKVKAFSDLIRLRSQYGTLLVLAPTLWSLFIASGGRPSAHHLFVFIVGAFFMRSAGCAVNDIADRGIDGRVERTSHRPLVSGRLGLGSAIVAFVVLALFAFALVLTLNRLTIALSFVAIILAAGYPFVKRVSHFPQTVLGMAFGWGAVMAWTAVTGEIGLAAILIFAANIFWSMAYDTIYALMDIEDDRRIGVKSTAIFFGSRVYQALIGLYVLMAACLALAGLWSGLGRVYFIGLALCFVIFIVGVFMVKARPEREVAYKGFCLNAWVGVLFFIFLVVEMNL